MYKILRKETFSPTTFLWEVEAAELAQAAQPGQFIIVRLHDYGERIPLTIADFDRKAGTITLVIQAVGKSTYEMMLKKEGESVQDVIGPLGLASHIEKKKVVLVGGGLGIAPVFPQLRAFKEMGSQTTAIIGFRNKGLIFWQEKFEKYCDKLIITTNDGSYGMKGFVTDALRKVCEEEKGIEEIIAIGPLVMMNACAETTRPFNIKTMVSLNTVMVDGTGMCGSCRCTIGGKTKFACVDGPDFDAHQVDWNEMKLREKRFHKDEKCALHIFKEKHPELFKSEAQNPKQI